MSDHGPYSDEIDVHGGTKGLLESGGKLKPSFVDAFIEAVSKGDLLVVVSWQESNLVSGGIGRETNLTCATILLAPALEWGSLLCGAALPKHVRYKRHERILIEKCQRFAPRGDQFCKLSRGKRGNISLRTEETDLVPIPIVLHEELVPRPDMLVEIPGQQCGGPRLARELSGGRGGNDVPCNGLVCSLREPC